MRAGSEFEAYAHAVQLRLDDIALIGRSGGDLLLGFRAPPGPSASLEVLVGGRRCAMMELPAQGGFVPAAYTSPLPLLCLRFHEVGVRLLAERPLRIEVIYGCLPPAARRSLAMRHWGLPDRWSWHCSGDVSDPGAWRWTSAPAESWTFGAGMMYHAISAVDGMLPSAHPWTLPSGPADHTPPPAARRAFLGVYQRELMQRTWRPDRLVQWCLDVEEAQAAPAPPRARRCPAHFTYMLRMDDVLVARHAVGPQTCMALCSWIDTAALAPSETPVRLLRAPRVAEALRQAVERTWPRLRVVGDAVSVGKYLPGQGLPTHRDGPLQGGDVSVVLCLNDHRTPLSFKATGHDTRGQPGFHVAARAGTLVVFSTDKLHSVGPLPASCGPRYMCGCEAVWYVHPRSEAGG